MQDISAKLQTYLDAWHSWAKQQKIGLDSLKPTHFGWKVASEAALSDQLSKLMPEVEQAHIGTVDNRKIALLALKKAPAGVPIMQLMQVRPGSADPLGLDHVAFLAKDLSALKESFAQTSHKWEEQSNPGHSWLSLWFGPEQLEAKFFDHTSLDIGAQELAEASQRIKA